MINLSYEEVKLAKKSGGIWQFWGKQISEKLSSYIWKTDEMRLIRLRGSGMAWSNSINGAILYF